MTSTTIEAGTAPLALKGRVIFYYTLFFLLIFHIFSQLSFAFSLFRYAPFDWNTIWLVIASNTLFIAFVIEAAVLYGEDRNFSRMSLIRLARFSPTREADLYLWAFISIMYAVGQSLASHSPWYTRHFPLFNLGPWVGGDVGMFFFLSFVGYLIHLLSHKIPALWELHKIHHSTKEMNGITVSREHVFFELFHLFMFASLFDMTNLLASKVFIGRSMLYILQHSRVNAKFGWIGHVIFSPHAHQIHHQSDPELTSRNFGPDITLWDRLFGSFLYEIPKTAAEMDRNFGLPPAEGPLGKSHIFFDLFQSAKRAAAVLPGRGGRLAD